MVVELVVASASAEGNGTTGVKRPDEAVIAGERVRLERVLELPVEATELEGDGGAAASGRGRLGSRCPSMWVW